MRYSIAVLFVLFLSMLAVGQKNVKIINKGDLQGLMDQKSIQLVDVRTSNEYKEGSIKGAINIDFWDPEFSKLMRANFDKKKPLVVYCAGGGRSAMACEKLSKQGFKILLDVDGGYEAYIE